MTLPRGFSGGVWGDGSADERWRAAAARGAAGFGSRAIDERGGGTAARARTPSGVPAVKGVQDRGSDGSNFEATRSPQQPVQARGAAASSSGDHLPVVPGFWPDPGGRKAARGSWDRPWPRNGAPVDDQSGAARPPAARPNRSDISKWQKE